MNYILKKIAYLFLVLGILGVLYSAYQLTHRVQTEKRFQLSALLSATEKPLKLDLPTKSADCKINGPLPDHGCTPGSVFSGATKEIICVSGYTKEVRNVSSKLKKQIYLRYGVNYPPDYGTYEVDHLVPLSLGGNNDESNLFPEASDPAPGFKEKDVVENYLHDEVCVGRVALSSAQELIAENWLSVYNNLDPAVIQEIKNKYKSWAN